MSDSNLDESISNLDESKFEDIEELFNDDGFEDLVAYYDAARDNIPADCSKCLEKVFGHTNFRDTQWKVISSVMNDKRDNCVVMATGYGKSLCYQFPSVYLNTVTIVVSPLISLMEDQVLSLKLNNIKACLLGTAQKDKSIFSDIFLFKYNIIYCTPEFLAGNGGVEFLEKLSPKLQLVAIDEAHCISKWGHDFRPSFRYLNRIRGIVPETPILAMTATATGDIRHDICKCLGLQNPQILCTGFDRPNLEFHVNEKSDLGEWADIGQIIKSVRIGSIIIYCLTRVSTEKVCKILRDRGVNCAFYHAGLNITERKKVHEDFVKDKVQVIVATIAFGMGIDKPDVRVVIHYGASKDIESYYQEVGRAGRDGMPAKCFMFHSRADWNTHEKLRETSLTSNELKEISRKLSLKMKEYVNTLECRRAFIIKYFENELSSLKKKLKNCCDNCNLNKADENLSNIYEHITSNGSYDFSRDAENLFKTIELFNGSRGLNIIILFLRGGKRQTLDQKYYKHTLFGTGKDKEEEWYKLLADLLELNNYIEKKGFQNKNFAPRTKFLYNAKVVSLTAKAKDWLNNPRHEPLLFTPNQSMLRFMKRKPGAASATSLIRNNIPSVKPSRNNSALIGELFKARSAIASQMNVMPYMVLSEKAILQLAQKCPLSLAELKASQLDGLSDAKVNQFGPSILKCILKFKNFLPRDELFTSEKSIKEYLWDCPLPNTKPLTANLLNIYQLFRAGKSLSEIAQEQRLASSTTMGYINEIIKNGLIVSKVDLKKIGVTDNNFEIIKDKLKSFDLNTVKLREIKEVCPPTVNYDNIKLVLSYHQLRSHIKTNGIPFEDPDEVKDSSNLSNLPGCSTSTAVADTPQNLTNPLIQMNSTAIVTDLIKDEEAIENINWDSEDGFDFKLIDNSEQIFNNSLVKTNPQKSEDENKISDLDSLIRDIQNEPNNINKTNAEDTKKAVKRKINVKIQESSIPYLDDSSEEETPVKRKLPEWLTKRNK